MQLPSFIYLDRYRNQGTRTYSDHAACTEADAAYRPDAATTEFELTLFELPREQMIVFTANPTPALSAAYLGKDRVMFGIHPQVLASVPDDPYVRHARTICTGRKTVAVVPSSSTRTLYVADWPPLHALKVHFPFKVSRYGRRMRREVLEQALNVSRELESGVDRLDGRFAFFREVIAVAHRNLQPDSPRAENWGYLVREMTPFPWMAPALALVPGFALYGKDYFEPDTPLLLYELIGDRDPLRFVLEQIMLPIVGHWVVCFRQFGYLIEPHGQNVVFEIGPEGSVRRIVYRDLSVGIDMRRRRDLGLAEGGLNHHNRMEHDVFHSITYDRFMGGHFFDRIVQACLDRYPGLCAEDFRAPCRETFARLLPEHRQYFPETVWYFSERRDSFDKPLFRDTGLAPVWRPWRR